MGSQFRIISWNGMKITVPESCQEIVSAPTHLVIESDYQPLVEIRWEKLSTRPKHSSTESIYREISKQRNSSCRKTQLPAPLAPFAKKHHAIGLRWEGGDLGIIWQCGQCSTILFCQIHLHPSFSLEQTADILMSLECCTDVIEYTQWALQDFQLRMPAGFLFVNSYFGAGITRLTFRGNNTILHTCRLAPASEKLAENTVRGILNTLNERFSSKESLCQENEKTVECWTTPSLISQVHHRLRRNKAFCAGCIRHDDISNRLFAVIAESNRPIDSELLRTTLQHYEFIQ